MEWLLFILLTLISLAIAYKDFKTQLISVWLLLAFTAVNFTNYLLLHSVYQFLENSIFCICYFLLCYLVLHLYFYIKTKKIQKLIDLKIGWGDVILFISVGCCIEPIYFIYFFTISFTLSLLIHLFFLKHNKNIAMAGFVVLFYTLYNIANYTKLI